MMSGMTFNSGMVGASIAKAAANASKALPYTLTNCAFEGRKELQSTMARYINNPTPRTVKGVFYRKAKPERNPYSEVAFSPLAWKWMKYQVLGGTRKGTAPVAARLNSYGNVVPSQRASKLRNSGAFRAYIGGIDGQWLRGAGGLRLMHVFKGSMQYRARLPMQAIVYGKAAKTFPVAWKKNIEIALRKSVGI